MSDEPSTNLTITAFCQACGTRLQFAESVVGRKARCLSCGHIFVVPAVHKKRPARSRRAHLPAGGQLLGKPITDPIESLPSEAAPVVNQDTDNPAPVQPHSQSPFDPLDHLADSEAHRSSKGAVTAAQSQESLEFSETTNYVEAASTTMSVITGMFYITLIIIGMVLIHVVLGTVLTIWFMLPLVVVYGKKCLMRIAFLLTGRNFAT